MSVMLSAASAIDWVAGVCGFETPASLYEAVAEAGELSQQEVFLPYLSGERTPHNNADAKGVFFGLSHNTDKPRMGQAALEGVAFGLADGMDALIDAGAKIENLSVIGGGARSEYWGRILASTLNVPLVYRDSATVGPAYGAAQLARLGVSGESISDVCKPPPITHVVEPDSEIRERLSKQRATFKSLYPLLKNHF